MAQYPLLPNEYDELMNLSKLKEERESLREGPKGFTDSRQLYEAMIKQYPDNFTKEMLDYASLGERLSSIPNRPGMMELPTGQSGAENLTTGYRGFPSGELPQILSTLGTMPPESSTVQVSSSPISTSSSAIERTPASIPKKLTTVPTDLSSKQIQKPTTELVPIQSTTSEQQLMEMQEPNYEQALLEAQKSRNLTQLMAGIGKAGSQLVGALTRTKPDVSAFETLESRAGQPIEDLLSQRKLRQEEEMMKSEMEKKKADSPISKAYREFAARMGFSVPNTTTADQLEKISPLFEKAFYAQKHAQSEKEIRGERQERFESAQSERYQKMAQFHPMYKTSIEAVNEIGTVKDLISDAYLKGGQSVAALGTKLAKAMGERGVLTENDVTRYVTNPKLAASIASKGKKAFAGKISEEDYNNLNRLVNLMETRANKNINKAYEETAVKMHRVTNIPLEKTRLLINPGLGWSETPVESRQPAQTKSGYTILKYKDGRQFSVPNDKVEQLLKSGEYGR